VFLLNVCSMFALYVYLLFVFFACFVLFIYIFCSYVYS
jgi:hypothetical protein